MGLYHCPQPGPGLDNHFWEEIFPNVEPKSLLAQGQSICSCPVHLLHGSRDWSPPCSSLLSGSCLEQDLPSAFISPSSIPPATPVGLVLQILPKLFCPFLDTHLNFSQPLNKLCYAGSWKSRQFKVCFWFQNLLFSGSIRTVNENLDSFSHFLGYSINAESNLFLHILSLFDLTTTICYDYNII